MPPAAPPIDDLPGTSADKPALRAHFRAARRDIDARSRRRRDGLINTAIESWVRHHGARRIAAYLPFDGEPDITPALKALDASGVVIYLPIIRSDEAERWLTFNHWSANEPADEGSQLQRNSFGIEEPGEGPARPVAELDVVFLPGVAWDRHGGRLGMGAGYYDRALAPVAHAARPLRIGVAYDLQKADRIPVSAHDVPLHGMVTESGLFTFGD